MNWQVSGASELSDTGAARSSSSSLSARMAAAAAALLRPEQIQRRLFGDGVVLPGVPGIHLVDGIPGHARHRLPSGSIWASWISSGYMVAT